MSRAAEEAIRLAGIADDAEDRLRDLERRAETARELSIPGPAPADLASARRLAKAARAAAEGAARQARRGGRAAA
jgi:hypothetical protein